MFATEKIKRKQVTYFDIFHASNGDYKTIRQIGGTEWKCMEKDSVKNEHISTHLFGPHSVMT